MMSAAAISEKSAFEKRVNVVIIYDDPTSAMKVNALLQRAFHQAGEVSVGNTKPWRLDLLNLPSTAAEALYDTADANLIVFALRPGRPVPDWLLTWLEQWAMRRHVGEAALAVFGGGSGAASARMMHDLPRFAERHRLNFIFDPYATAHDEVRTDDSLPSGLHRGPRLQRIMDEAAHEHWGINE